MDDSSRPSSISASANEPLIGVLVDENGDRLVHYFVGDPDAAAQAEPDETLRAALSVIGAWSDLDWQAFSAELERIRHASKPTPPIDL